MPGYRWGSNPPPDWIAPEGLLLMRWRRDLMIPEIRSTLGFDTSFDGRMYEWIRDILLNRGKSEKEIKAMLREVEARAEKEVKPEEDDEWRSLLVGEKVAIIWAEKLWDEEPEKIAVFEDVTRTWKYILRVMAGDSWYKNKKKPATQKAPGDAPQPKRSWYDFYYLSYSKLTAEEIDRLLIEAGPTNEERLEFEEQQREKAKNKKTFQEAVDELSNFFDDD
ncbi:MAG: hypothetical protein JW943_10480 [Deltaproteobacteria bacterium]|nr:hypothetical protein [Deltaproteobacteria bacterium]